MILQNSFNSLRLTTRAPANSAPAIHQISHSVRYCRTEFLSAVSLIDRHTSPSLSLECYTARDCMRFTKPLKYVLSRLRPRPPLLDSRPLSFIERRTVKRKIAELSPWFHNMNLAKAIWTNPEVNGPGPDYPAWRWHLVQPLIGDVSGKRCLDIGCSSGFFSLKMKQLGAASVLGVDQGEQVRAIEQARYAASCVAVEVDFRTLSVYELVSLKDSFDLVLFMGVFYHLRHPLLALEAIRHVCRGRIVLQTITTPHEMNGQTTLPASQTDSGLREPISVQGPLLRFIPGALDGDVSCWFVPNVEAVAAMLTSCGFTLEKAVYPTAHEIIISAKAS